MKYFEINELLDKYPDKLIYIIISGRGYGKSWSLQKKMIDDFLEYGAQSVVLRRLKTQADEMQETYFDKLLESGAYDGYTFKRVHNKMYIDGKLFCTFLALNGSGVGRGGSYGKVMNIVVEEIMPEPGEHKVNREYQKLESFLATVDRFEDRIKVFCVGNNTGYYSPIFDALKLYPTLKEEGYTSNEVAVIQKAQSSNEFKETVRKTKLGRLMELTGTAKYNIDNENISNDTFNCVNKKELKETNKLKLKFRVRVDKDKVITIWECQGKEVSYYYVDNATKGLTQEYFFDFEYQKGNNKHITQLNPYTIKELELNNKLGYIYFNNPETKYLFNQINLFFKNSKGGK